MPQVYGSTIAITLPLQADFYREQLVQEAAGAQAALESERVRLREAMETERTACATRVREVHSSSNTL